MTKYSSKLPSEFLMRPARAKDKWSIQKLVWQFTLAEALEFDLRFISPYVLIIIGLSLFLRAQLAWMFYTSSAGLKGVIFIFILFNVQLIFHYAFWLIRYIIQEIIGAVLNWQRYWVIEYNQRLVACTVLSLYETYSELAHLFVKPAWRDQGLASFLVRGLVQEAPKPVYLICKPKMIPFYNNLGFVLISGNELNPRAQANYKIYSLRRFRGFPMKIMQYVG